MPLVRYEVRCEHSLANPELYRTAARDDSEGLLEGVAMAGLVGIVRQLGDMAEFAAEIFQDLHDDIMAIVSRGQHLKTRVTRLEANLPAVEKTLLAEASQYKFAYSARSKWRAPLPMDQNLCTQAELPRFVRNFYDDCRGPPRLFLLDKFDEAGRGACVKRYTDPTFFKLVWATSQLEKAEQVRRERESEQLKRSSATDKGLNSNGPKIYARERLSSALFENLEGFTGDFTLDLRSRRLDRVLEIPTEGELTPDGSRSPAEPRSPERSFQKRQLPEVAEGPVLAPLKISVKDIENAKLGRRILRLNNGELSDEEEESSADFYVDALTTMGSDADSEPDSRTRWDAEVQSRFAMESDQVTALNHSVLKAHVESHRHTPPSGSDDLDHNDVFARRLGLKEPGSPVAGSDTVGESKDSAESRGRQPSVEDEASRSSHGGRPSIEDAESRFADESIANEAFTSEEDARDGHAIVPENVHEDPLLLLEPSDVVPNTLPEKHPDKLSDVLPNKPADKLPAKLFERLPIKSANKLADKTTYQSHESVSLQEVYRASAKVKELKQRASAEATVQPPVLDNKLPEPRKDKQLALVNVEQTVVTPRSRRLWAKDNSSQLQTGGILSLGDNIERRGASLRLNGGSELSNLLRARMLGGSGHFHEETTNSREIVLHEEQDQFVKLPALRTGYEVTFRSSSSSTSSPYTNVSSSDVVEGDDGGYTSSASSSPKGPNFCALLSPPESPPRVAGGLMGSPAAYNTNPHFGSKEITKLTLPVTPFLSISPTVSRSPSLDQDLSVSLGDELPQNYSAEAGSGPQAAPQRISPPQRHNTLGSSLAPQTRNGPVASLADSDKLKNAPVTESGSSNENGCLQVEPNRSQFSTLPNPVPRPRTWVDRSESNVAATLRAIRQAAALESDQDDDTGSECRSDC